MPGSRERCDSRPSATRTALYFEIVSFFERAAINAPQPPPPEPEPATPDWIEPPSGVVPGQSTQQVVLFRTDRAILVIRQFDVYPTGVEFTIDLRVRPTTNQLFDTPWELHWRSIRREPTGEVLPDDFLRIGFAFADGTTWTNFNHDFRGFDEDPTGPVVIGRGGGGGGHRWNMRYWMWPLPPAGDVVMYAEWPLFDIDEVSAVIDGAALRRDAEKAQLISE
jgi:hypothetical protein